MCTCRVVSSDTCPVVVRCIAVMKANDIRVDNKRKFFFWSKVGKIKAEDCFSTGVGLGV